MLTTVAILVIVLGLMVSLARNVRKQAAVALTRDLIRRLDALMGHYTARYDGRVPEVSVFPPPTDRDRGTAPAGPRGRHAQPEFQPAPAFAPGAEDPPIAYDPDAYDKRELVEAASLNNQEFVRALRSEPTLTAPALQDMPVSMYDETYLRDAWGSPIVFMPAKHPLVGTAPQNRFFFFSAGPDRSYLTPDDNLYSYEETGAGR
jgi:hypothetical protein